MRKYFSNGNGLLDSSTDYRSVRSGLLAPPQYLDIDLSTARSVAAGTALNFTLGANEIYVDQNPIVGNATIYFNPQGSSSAQHLTPVYLLPGFIARVPFIDCLLENAAQPGKIMRIIYGTDIEFVPGTAAQVNIGGTVGITDKGTGFTTGYANLSSLAANTPVAMVSAASNVNGILLASAFAYGRYSVESALNLMAKATAPSSVTDGIPLLTSEYFLASTIAINSRLNTPLLVPPGLGLYFISAAADTWGYRGAAFTIL